MTQAKEVSASREATEPSEKLVEAAREVTKTLQKVFAGQKIPATINGVLGESAFFTSDAQLAYAAQIAASFAAQQMEECAKIAEESCGLVWHEIAAAIRERMQGK